MTKGGFDFDKFLKGTLKAGGTALLGTAAYEAIRDPSGAGAAMARDMAIEGVGLAARMGAGAAGALPIILDSTATAGPELSEMPPQRTDFIPAPEVEETDTEMMERIATRDAGMIPEPSRVPEAAPAQDQGFLSR